MKLILYSKPDCCLCQSLLEKLQEVLKLNRVQFDLEVREITSNLNWFDKYEYEVPVLCLWNEKLDPPQEQQLPRFPPRSPVSKLEQLLQRYES
ncbi:glutaredoxin family protein [Tumidithrix helvetica PCC 7403]|uniref:glutaredoxin family protein n=1 Tax=Tumidithrix helvetica TaxID=3457545 RepID=UPI003CBA731D